MPSIIPQFLNKISNSNFVKNHVTKSIKDPSFLTKTLLLTSVSKDVFAYALRVNNTAKNKEIPEDKKHFVITMDAVTGVTTAVVQIGTGFLIANKKLQNAICSRLFSNFEKNSRAYKNASRGFAALSTLIGATLFAKRVIVPAVSSKIAEKIEHNYQEKRKAENEKTQKTFVA